MGLLWDEAAIVVARTASEQATDATLMQMALSTTPNMGVKPATTRRAIGLFQRVVKMMRGRDGDQ